MVNVRLCDIDNCWKVESVVQLECHEAALMTLWVFIRPLKGFFPRAREY